MTEGGGRTDNIQQHPRLPSLSALPRSPILSASHIRLRSLVPLLSFCSARNMTSIFKEQSSISPPALNQSPPLSTNLSPILASTIANNKHKENLITCLLRRPPSNLWKMNPLLRLQRAIEDSPTYLRRGEQAAVTDPKFDQPVITKWESFMTHPLSLRMTVYLLYVLYSTHPSLLSRTF